MTRPTSKVLVLGACVLAGLALSAMLLGHWYRAVDNVLEFVLCVALHHYVRKDEDRDRP